MNDPTWLFLAALIVAALLPAAAIGCLIERFILPRWFAWRRKQWK